MLTWSARLPARRKVRLVRPRLPLAALLATVLVVPTTVVLPTVTSGRDAPRPVATGLSTLRLAGVDAVALREEPVPEGLVEHLAEEQRLPVAVASRRAAAATPAVLTGRLATADYAMLGVTWLPNAAPVDLALSVRSRTDGRWSEWQELHQLADTASGRELASSTRLGTAPQWVGPSDGVQVRVDVLSGTLPEGLRVDLVDPGTSPADDDIARPDPSATAAAAAGRPDIVTRAEWGADESLRDRRLEMSRTVKAAFVHHTAGSNSYSEAEAPAVVRGLLAYTTQSMGYADIPYNFLVDKYGRIYEGRAGSITSPVRQGATGGFNRDTMSVVAMGNFVSFGAPDVMVSGIARILAYRLAAYHRDPYGRKVLVAEDGSSKYDPGDRGTFKVISGHRNTGYTACPGDRLYERLPEIRRQVLRLMGAGFVEPSVSAATSSYGQPSDFQVSSRALTAMDWQLTVSRACEGRVVRRVTGAAAPGEPVDARWTGRNDNGRLVPAGRYVLSLTGGSASSKAVTWRTTVQVQVGSPGAPPTLKQLPASPGGRFVATRPTRLMSTSDGSGLAAPVLLGAGARVQVDVLGRAGVPASDVTAVAVNVLAACAAGATTVSVAPSGLAAGPAGAVSVDGNSSARGLAVSGLGPDGALTVRNARGAVSVSLSVVGYWTTASGGDGFVALPRRPLPGTGAGLVVGQTPVTVDVAGNAGVPESADAVVLNVRRAATGSGRAVWVWPSDDTRPGPAALSRDPGEAAQQRVVVPLGRDGGLRLAADGESRLVVDVVGYLGDAGSAFHAVAPTTVTASGLTLEAGRSTRVTVRGVAGVPRAAEAAVLQLSGTGARDLTRLVVYPAGAEVPRASDLSVPKRRDRTNLVVVPLGDEGRLRLLNRDARVGASLTLVGWLG